MGNVHHFTPFLSSVFAFNPRAEGLLLCQEKALPLTAFQKQQKGMACSALHRGTPHLPSVLWALLTDLFHHWPVRKRLYLLPERKNI